MTTGGSNDPLHGLTLATILDQLVATHGWEGLARRIEVRCFQFDPSIKSSLTFLRRTPWARKMVEELYLEGLGKPKKPNEAWTLAAPSAPSAPPRSSPPRR